tara:strand:+ start:1325 stop:2422 length:1098 start_codon:yes stop_codon:yes gene_type:complete
MIKFFDIYNQDKNLFDNIFKDIKKNIYKNDFILGRNVTKFENNFAKLCNAKYAISCSNGTDALTLSLKALNLPNDSQVIIPAMTFCSTAFAVINAGLTPILVDIGENEPTISVEKIKEKINKKTKVIIPVHLYGSSADLSGIKKITQKKKIKIIDDCAQAHGGIDDSSKSKNLKIGSSVDISCFSFYPSKNLGAYGDAGIITTNNKNYYLLLRNLRNLGCTKKFLHTKVGMNSRMDTIQASILLNKLKNLKKYNKNRKIIASLYNEKIVNSKIRKLKYSKNCVYHQYVILVKQRSKLIKVFKKENIQFGFHYPHPIHKLKALKKLYKNQKYINAEQIAKQGLSIPIDPNLNKKEVSKIINVLNNF